MPKLDKPSITQWVALQDDPLRREIEQQDREETWPVDRDDSLEPDLSDLGNALDRAALRPGDPLTDEEILAEFRVIVANLAPPRRMRLMVWLAETGWAHGGVAMMGDDPAEANAIRSSMTRLNRRGLLNRLFSPENLAPIIRAIEKGNGSSTTGGNR